MISLGKKDEGTNRTYCHPRRSTVERLGALTGGAAKRPMQVFQGASCKNGPPADWTTIDVSDRAFLTARDGDVVLVTTGDGTFARE